VLLLASALSIFATEAFASPWVEVGNSQLRSDIELLAEAGVIDNITTQWPLPWGGILARLDSPSALYNQPNYIRAAAQRVQRAGEAQTQTHQLRVSISSDFTNNPDVVRGFDGMGRAQAQGQISAEYLWSSTAVRINVGVQSASLNPAFRYPLGITPTYNPNGYGSPYYPNIIPDHQVLMLDGSYIAQRIGNAVVYAGYLSHWWGPGWVSADLLSNNARPMPQIGISRISTTPFKWPVLSWFGPWQAEVFFGLLDGPRLNRNTIYDGARVTFSPIRGLEIGISRTQLMCGANHPCKPLQSFINLTNSTTHLDHANSEGQYDVRYTGNVWQVPFEIYAETEFGNAGPPEPIGATHLVGSSIWLPIEGHRVRFTLEYDNTIPTYNLFTFSIPTQGSTYNTPKYFDGLRYRGRALGSSLDTDSELESLQVSWNGSHNETYTLTYNHAGIGGLQDTGVPQGGAANAGNVWGNGVTTAPVHFNLIEARIAFPWRNWKFDLAARVQDDQPRPNRGFTGAVEIATQYSF
jgi:hypothetical protein